MKADNGGRPQRQLVVCAEHSFVVDPHVELLAKGRACSEGAAAVVYHGVGAIGTEALAGRTQPQRPVVVDVRAQEDLDVALLKREGNVDARSVGAWPVVRRVAAAVDAITGRAQGPQPGRLALTAVGTVMTVIVLSMPCATSNGRIGRASCSTRRPKYRATSSPPIQKIGRHPVHTSSR